MASIIYQGTTPTIRFKPLNGMQVGDLGTPSVYISQALRFIAIDPERITVDDTSNTISFKLTEEETLSLVDGVATEIQAVFEHESGDIYRFPVYAGLIIGRTLADTMNPQEEEPEEPDATEEEEEQDV